MMLTPKELRERLIANSCGSDDYTPNIRINCVAPEPARAPVFVPPPATPVSTIILNRLDSIEKRQIRIEEYLRRIDESIN